MGLYIQGIELPKEQNVPTWAVIFSNGEVRIYKDGFNTDQGNGKGTAIPVPPHGRLIDADAEIYIEVLDDMTEDYSIKKCTVKEALDLWTRDGCPPTIISAEEDKPT